jgi:hypothetical protein
MSDEDMSSLLPDEEAAAVIDVVRNLLLAYEDERPDVAADMLLEAAERWHRYRITLVLGISSARHMRIQLALTKAATGQPAMAGFEYGKDCDHDHSMGNDPMVAALQLMTANANGDKEMADALTRTAIGREEEYWLDVCLALVELTAEGLEASYQVPVVLHHPPMFGEN